ncbi:TPA: dTMP kinase [Candidatus Dependentiae bacterium]|nr:MAG: Thymidylate kinase [candidate division TM6 bacterium GW2011_GWF2_43_87]HBL98522.1 dTMP kinase [Candidatus Dependentiae bacterium]
MNRLAQGFLIAVEGLDGVGKTTLCENLIKILEKEGFSTLKTRQPGGTPIGSKIREILHKSTERPTYLAEYLLLAADRAQHMETVILPALESGTLVISDRMGDSSLAYQGYGRGLDKDFINQVNKKAMQGHVPDLTIYVRLEPSEALKRLESRGTAATAIEQESQAFFKRVAHGFETLYATPAPHLLTLDARKTPDILAKEAYLKIIELINTEKRCGSC